jgi:hypothetical protein
MVVIVTTDEELLARICNAVGGEKWAITAPGDGVLGPKQLRHEIYSCQPSVVLLDVRFGGQRYRVIESVPKLMLNCESQPEIVLMIPSPSKAVRTVANDCGCWGVVDFSRRGFAEELADLVSAALVHRASPLLPNPRGRLVSLLVH